MFNDACILLDGIPMPDFLIVTGCSHDITGSIEHDIADTPGYSGVNIKGTKKNPRSIVIDFKYRDSGFLNYEKKEEISNWIHSNDLKESKLMFSWIPDSHYLVVPNNATSLTDSIKLKSFSIEFLMINPYRIDNRENIVGSNFFYMGTEKTYPMIYIDVINQCTKIKLIFENSEISSFLELNTNFKVGDKIVIDSKRKSIKVNDKYNMPILSLDSDFPIISKGKNNYIVTEGNIDLKIKYHNMYR